MSNRLDIPANDLRVFWMTFTANRQIKQSPRMLAGATGDIIALSPPLIILKDQIDELFETLRTVLKGVA